MDFQIGRGLPSGLQHILRAQAARQAKDVVEIEVLQRSVRRDAPQTRLHQREQESGTVTFVAFVDAIAQNRVVVCELMRKDIASLLGLREHLAVNDDYPQGETYIPRTRWPACRNGQSAT